MVNYVLIAGLVTVIWILYASFRVAPWCEKRWITWGGLSAALAFVAGELLILIVVLRYLGTP